MAIAVNTYKMNESTSYLFNLYKRLKQYCQLIVTLLKKIA
jgi:hypothetical protein